MRYIKSLIHNCIIHPLMMLPFLSTEQAHKLHDENVKWAYGDMLFDEIGIETYLWVSRLSLDELCRLSRYVHEEIEQRKLDDKGSL